MCRPTPLYGQPSWWGEEDYGSKTHRRDEPDTGACSFSSVSVPVSLLTLWSHLSVLCTLTCGRADVDAPVRVGSPEEPRAGPGGAKADSHSSSLVFLSSFFLTEVQKDASSVGPDGSQQKSVFLSYQREPSYFEIPTKDFQQPKASEPEVHEVPTKDTDTPPACSSPPTSTPAVVQSHASFTIEFDDGTPGKIKIKDHITKFSTRQRKSLPAKVAVATPTDVMSAESKVADWLVRSDVSVMKRRPTSADVYSTKSDLAASTRTLKGQTLLVLHHSYLIGSGVAGARTLNQKRAASPRRPHCQTGLFCSGHRHEDGTQSDSEEPALHGGPAPSQKAAQRLEDRSVLVQPAAPTQVLHKPLQDPAPPSAGPDHVLTQRSPRGHSPAADSSQRGPHEQLGQQAFIIEFFDDNPRKKRSQSFTHNPVLAEPLPSLKSKTERRKGGERPASVHGHVAPTQQVMVPLKSQGHSGPQRSSSLKRDKTEQEAASSSSSIIIRPFGSVGKQSKLARDFAAEVQQETSPTRDRASTPTRDRASTPTRDRACTPPMSAPPVMGTPPTWMISAAEGLLTAPHLRPTSTFQPPGKSDSASRPAGPPGGAEPKGPQRVRAEEDDSLSDAGTYTIETEAQDKEVEQARSMIDQVSGPRSLRPRLQGTDRPSAALLAGLVAVATAASPREPAVFPQVFGVLDSPESSGGSPGVYRPVILDGTDANLDAELAAPVSSLQPGQGPGLEGPKWVSCWASLADSYTGDGSGSGPAPPQGDCLEGAVPPVRSTLSLVRVVAAWLV